jgi:hypothetical protein
LDDIDPQEPLPLVSRAEVDFLDELIQRVFELLFNPDVVTENRAAELASLAEVYQFDYDQRTAPERPAQPHSPELTVFWQRYRACSSPAAGN